MTLIYRPAAEIEDLAIGECTMRRTVGANGDRWWQLWFHVRRDSDGEPEIFEVPVAPGGSYSESGPGGRTWGLTARGGGVWQVAPSINVLDSRDRAAGEHHFPSLWHQTPEILSVPDGEPWAIGAAP